MAGSQSHSLQESLHETLLQVDTQRVYSHKSSSRYKAVLCFSLTLDATVFAALSVLCLIWPEWTLASTSGDSRQAVSDSAVYATRSVGVLAGGVSLLSAIAAIASARDDLLMPVATAAIISLVCTGNVLLDVHEGGVTIWSSVAMCAHAGTSIGLIVLNMLGLMSVIVGVIRSAAKPKPWSGEPDGHATLTGGGSNSTLPPGRRRLLSVTPRIYPLLCTTRAVGPRSSCRSASLGAIAPFLSCAAGQATEMDHRPRLHRTDRSAAVFTCR